MDTKQKEGAKPFTTKNHFGGSQVFHLQSVNNRTIKDYNVQYAHIGILLLSQGVPHGKSFRLVLTQGY